nr:MAG TPA: hypothetical protein [Caudoviricetes sp.]
MWCSCFEQHECHLSQINENFDGRRMPSAMLVSFLVSFFFAAKEKST